MKECKVFSIVCVLTKPRTSINAFYKPNFHTCRPSFASSCQLPNFTIFYHFSNEEFIILSLVKDARKQVQKTTKKGMTAFTKTLIVTMEPLVIP